jgi:hypothetical protein
MLKQVLYRGPSLEVLHEEYAKKGIIDEAAPIKTASDIYCAQLSGLEPPINLPAWPRSTPPFAA